MQLQFLRKTGCLQLWPLKWFYEDCANCKWNHTDLSREDWSQKEPLNIHPLARANVPPEKQPPLTPRWLESCLHWQITAKCFTNLKINCSYWNWMNYVASPGSLWACPSKAHIYFSDIISMSSLYKGFGRVSFWLPSNILKGQKKGRGMLEQYQWVNLYLFHRFSFQNSWGGGGWGRKGCVMLTIVLLLL